MNGPCEKCGTERNGKNYEFFYGKCVEEVRPIGPIHGWAKYSTNNAQAFICKKCVSSRRIRELRAPLLASSIALASVAILYVSFTYQILASAQWLFWLPMLAVFGVIGGVPSSIGWVIKWIWDYPSIGNTIAKETKKVEYANLGYTSLWTPKEYKNLKRTF